MEGLTRAGISAVALLLSASAMGKISPSDIKELGHVGYGVYAPDSALDNPSTKLDCVVASSVPVRSSKSATNNLDKQKLTLASGKDYTISIGGKVRTDSFASSQANRYNKDNVDADGNKVDKIARIQGTLDWALETELGKNKFKVPVVASKVAIRTKGTWGNRDSIASTASVEPKLMSARNGSHSHSFGKHMIWMREGWLKLNINDVFGLFFDNPQVLTLGAFPFSMGRGIALGSSFSVNPGNLGFYTDNVVDQYAYGVRFNGVAKEDVIEYDLYGGLISTFDDSFSNVSANVLGQEPGRRFNQMRGSGKTNFIVASRLKWHPIAGKDGDAKLCLEPYALYNRDPNQKVEFLHDAKSDLGTLGWATELKVGDFELGFDVARNVGSQKVKAWDRNKVKIEERKGRPVQIYSDVVATDGTTSYKVVLAKKDGKGVTNGTWATVQSSVDRSGQSTDGNNATITLKDSTGAASSATLYIDSDGVISDDSSGTAVTLKSSSSRVRAGYKNKYQGNMIVADASYWLHKDVLKVSSMFGYASGDENPNADLESPGDSSVDGAYGGFIPLQSTYTGSRVKSSFVLAGRIPRLLSLPLPGSNVNNPFASTVNSMTNLVFAGASVRWTPESDKKWDVHSNMMTYWQAHATKILSDGSSDTYAAKHLGFELNTFVECSPVTDMKFYGVGSIFFPGQHYTDIKGRALNSAQKTFIDSLDWTGVDGAEATPLLGDNVALFFNLGFEYKI
ncbi:hypothetical protein HOF26_02525 [bacterium]|nr:hypothetical protein [bacterium]MBT3903678.1 hypothetical protein [bacterium]MBT6130967.1 hypothetical protein [bacterium]